MKVTTNNPEQVVKRAMWLAWQACGGAVGMGVFRDNPDANEDAVWKSMYERYDYPGGNSHGDNKPGRVYADYVYGRMMKVGFEWDGNSVTCRDDDYVPRGDYQGWCGKYPLYRSLVEAAIASLQTT